MLSVFGLLYENYRVADFQDIKDTGATENVNDIVNDLLHSHPHSHLFAVPTRSMEASASDIEQVN
jgi:hypothetical protein